MKPTSIQAIRQALNQAGTEHLIVGGIAVNSHGYPRATRNPDLVSALDEGNARTAMHTLAGLGCKPCLPVPASGFDDVGTQRTGSRTRP